MPLCPECNVPISKYVVDDWVEQICWNCGHYESDSPAYKTSPSLFKNIVRDNPHYFIRKFLRIVPADESLHERQNRRRLDGIPIHGPM